jgi:serine/threonine-protein kinase
VLADVNTYVQIPQQLNNLIMSCLEKKPNQLPQNMGEILKVFADIEQSI